MSAVYGAVKGNRAEASRGGTKDSGICAYTQTWNTRVTIDMQHDDHAIVYASRRDGSERVVMFEGDVNELLENGKRPVSRDAIMNVHSGDVTLDDDDDVLPARG